MSTLCATLSVFATVPPQPSTFPVGSEALLTDAVEATRSLVATYQLVGEQVEDFDPDARDSDHKGMIAEKLVSLLRRRPAGIETHPRGHARGRLLRRQGRVRAPNAMITR